MLDRLKPIALALMAGTVAVSALQVIDLFWVERVPGQVIACHPDVRVSSAPQPGLPATQTVRMVLEAELAGSGGGAKVRVPTWKSWGEACPTGQTFVFIRPRLGTGALRLDGDYIDWAERFGLPLMMLAASVVLGAGARISDRKMQR